MSEPAPQPRPDSLGAVLLEEIVLPTVPRSGQAMQNCKMSIEKNTLTIVIDLSKSLGPSKSGKTNLIATTGGAAEVGPEGKYSVNVNVYTKTGGGK